MLKDPSFLQERQIGEGLLAVLLTGLDQSCSGKTTETFKGPPGSLCVWGGPSPPVLTVGRLWRGSEAGGAAVNDGVARQVGQECYRVKEPTDICRS